MTGVTAGTKVKIRAQDAGQSLVNRFTRYDDPGAGQPFAEC